MARFREYKIIAGMHCIKLNPTDPKDLKLKLGDLIDIEDLVILSSEKKKNRNKKEGQMDNGNTK